MSFRRAAFTALLAMLLLSPGFPGGSAIAGPGVPTLGSMHYAEHYAVDLMVPWEYPTVQAAINAARPGDTIVVSAGEFDEALTIQGLSGLTLRGAGARATTIRAAGTVLRVEDCRPIHIEGIRFESSAETAIETYGSGVNFRYNIVVADAPSGRARIRLQCIRSSDFARNTFVRPEGATGPFLELNPDPCAGSAPVLVRRNMFWTWGKPVADYANRAVIDQNNLGVVDSGDYPAENLFAFPLFCDPEERIYTLGPGSPCLPDNNPWGRTIGALGMGCGPVGVEPTSWGRIKNGYR